MSAQEKVTITDKTPLSTLTVGDLKAIVREIVEDSIERAILEIQQQLPDPDEGLEFKPEFAEQLRQFLKERPEGRPAEDVMRELGLSDEVE
ncbi:MAG: hypothetical protein D6737_14180 [Chloroflexi bacterium]|nr:MAG: hypothetical protein D6737_14180 [Chloroflexota bacterium]